MLREKCCNVEPTSSKWFLMNRAKYIFKYGRFTINKPCLVKISIQFRKKKSYPKKGLKYQKNSMQRHGTTGSK